MCLSLVVFNRMNKRIIIGLVIVLVLASSGYLLSEKIKNHSYSEEVSYSSSGGSGGYDVAADSIALTDTAYAKNGEGMAQQRAMSNAVPTGMPLPPSVQPGVAPDVQERMVVRNGTVSLVVKNVSTTADAIYSLVARSNGFIGSSSLYKNGTALIGTLTLRIPVKNFDAVVAEIKTMGELVNENFQGVDVTAQYVDLDSNLRNLRATEEQLLLIMKKATRISDVLEVQNQLTYTRGQIQTIQGQMNYLKQTSDYASLTVTLTTDPSTLPVVEKEGEKWRPLATFKAAIRTLISFAQALVDILIWFVIFLPLAALVLGGIYWMVRKTLIKR